MVLFIAIILVIVVVGVVVIVRGGEQALELDRQDRELAEKVQDVGDLTAPFPAIVAVKDDIQEATKDDESWTLDSVEDTSGEAESE